MLLRSSISSTKKFFQKTIKNFMTFFSPGYERLPKTPPRNHLSYSDVAASGTSIDMDNNNSNTSYQELDNYYTDSNENWDSERVRSKIRIKNKKYALQSPTTMQENNEVYSGSYISLSNNNSNNNASPAKKNHHHHVVEKRSDEYEKQNKNKGLTNQKGRQKDSSTFNSIGIMREHRNCIVEQKLRELEMIDMSNVDYVLDIEEVIHYYSRLTCPAYLEIVDRFFMEMYSEIFGPAWSASPLSVNSRMKLRYHHQ